MRIEPGIPETPEKRPSRRRRGGLLALAATLVVIVLAVAIFGVPGLFPGLRKSAAQPQPAAPSIDLTQYTLHDIAMVSPTEGWAVGNTETVVDSNTGRTMDAGDPVILHYRSGRWTLDPVPDVSRLLGCSGLPKYCPKVTLRDISMLSAREGWVTGRTGISPYADGPPPFPIALYYKDGRWNWANEQDAISGISMRSATDAWAFKTVGDAGHWTVEHYDGQSWTPYSDPRFDDISASDLVETSDGQVWVSGVDNSVSVGDGFDGNSPAVLLHYDGQGWSEIDPQLANARLMSLAFASPDEGWAVGYQPDTDQSRAGEIDGLIAHYINGAWEQQTLFEEPSGQSSYFTFYSVAMVSPDEGWVVGLEGVILHYHQGAWSQIQSPTGQKLERVVMVSPAEGWAIGEGVMLHYRAGAWNMYKG